MQNSHKLLQAIGIPYTALLSVMLGLFLVSFPMGIYVVFESEIGDDINFEYPFSYLELFEGTSFYQSNVDVSIGDVFVILWVFYVILFTIALLGPKQNFLKSISPMISSGNFTSKLNYMVGITKWFSILILVSALINTVQEKFGIVITPPTATNDLIHFFYVSLAPVMEEFGFRLLLIGIPLFALYSNSSSVKYFLKSLWNPDNLNIYDYKKAFLLIAFVGILFGFAHIAFGDSWSHGKFAQAAASGIILGWVYLRYGFVASILIHWATNYFIFSYANFVSQLNFISLESTFSHSLMSSLELLFLVCGALSVSVLFASRLFSKNEFSLKV